jgi:hypothetical protein
MISLAVFAACVKHRRVYAQADVYAAERTSVTQLTRPGSGPNAVGDFCWRMR